MFKKIVTLLLLMIIILALVSCEKDDPNPNYDVKFIAHRGLSSEYYANTYDAFLAAAQSDFFFGVETDIWFTSDNIPVTVHDIDQFQDTSKKITDITYEEAMSLRLNLEKSKYIDEGEYYLCDFETYLDIVVSNNKTPIIEIKGPMDEEQREILFGMIEEKTTLYDVIFISFDVDTIDRIVAADQDIRVQVLTSKVLKTLSLRSKDYSLGVSYKRLSTKLVKDAHEKDKEVNVWTINNIKDVERCINMGVDYITTDFIWDLDEIID